MAGRCTLRTSSLPWSVRAYGLPCRCCFRLRRALQAETRPVRIESGNSKRRGSFVARLWLCFFVAAAMGGGLAWRWHHLQVVRYSHFEGLSEDNQIALQLTGPIRGAIMDRNGVVLADNHIRYQLRVNSDNAAKVLRNLDLFREHVKISRLAEKKLKEAAESSVYAGEVVISDYLVEKEVVSFVSIQQVHPEVVLDAKMVRRYPNGDSAGHLVGNVGRIDPDDKQRLQDRGKWRSYAGSDFIGKRGIEAMYETKLHGEPGMREAQIDAHGRVLETVLRMPPTSGLDVWLTLDHGLQQKAESLLGDREGAIVAMDPFSGAILALASSPRFDGNEFIGGVSEDKWSWLNSEESGSPMVHRAIYGQYAPGSTIKPFLALSALDEGWRDMNYSYNSTGVFFLTPRHRFHDWKAGGHGSVDIPKSIIRSVNSFYYQLAHDVGVDAIHDALKKFGFGQKTGIDLGGERSGLLPTEAWKKATFDEIWYPGDTIPIGVGQGYLEVTPLQQARAMSVIANGGTLVTPHLVARVGSARLRPQPSATNLFKPGHIRIVRDALAKVTLPGGTAWTRVGKDSPYPIAGKTGTAQVTRILYDGGGRIKNEDLPEHLRDHAWFVGFAPAYNPRIVVAAVIEHGGSGGRTAGPVVRAVMDHYLLSERNMRFEKAGQGEAAGVALLEAAQ